MSSIATADQNQAVGARLASIRASTGLSQNAFADSLGLSARAYANYERGEREMPVALFRALFDEHGVDPLWLLVGPEPEPVQAMERRLDMGLLEDVVRVVEGGLHRANKKLKPDKKARLIRLAYERCMLAGEINRQEIHDLLSLAA
ncbi:MAG TPA: helix-turn-helix transcriptional regulator [Rhodanobacteraceae bacterium]|jgi:transcriptional regulator with XRE-family HTH domain|nr:helix-turn-helix transcriptional regulator [Rhodanobacteraceae bacterium]